MMTASRKMYDNIRDNKIKNKLGCNIIRINEKDFLGRINNKPLDKFVGVQNV